jgi:hypothetical protein
VETDFGEREYKELVNEEGRKFELVKQQILQMRNCPRRNILHIMPDLTSSKVKNEKRYCTVHCSIPHLECKSVI